MLIQQPVLDSALAASAGLKDGDLWLEPEESSEVSNFPSFDYSMREVREAGKIICGPLNAEDLNVDQAAWAFKVAHNWRDAHAYPLKSVRSQISAYNSILSLNGFTAGRLKRMQAIRRKLNRIGPGLNQLQDLAGCRAVLNTPEEVKLLKETLIDRSRHLLRREDDYIEQPKEKDGYRSCHLIFQFQGKGDSSVFDGRRVEVQVRTRLQHSWATSVEAVGLFRGEDLKGSKGDPRWLRLFKLVSAEFAELENCPLVGGVGSRKERKQEIAALDNELNAVDLLENLSNAVSWVDDAVKTAEMPVYYLIKYHNDSYQVEVRPYYHPMRATHDYDQAEAKSSEDNTTVVLVEAGKVNQLREAYPNYFGDVQHFKDNLKRIAKGRDVKPYVVTPQERVRQLREQLVDPRWLRRRGQWRRVSH